MYFFPLYRTHLLQFFLLRSFVPHALEYTTRSEVSDGGVMTLPHTRPFVA